jgi:ATP-dependent Clp protease ATP-binding subunit ClpB
MLDPLVGRDDELRRLIHILSRRTKNNPVLLGQSGVGKTAIVEGLAQRIVSGDVPAPLRGARLLELDLGAVGAGCQMPGEFEERLSIVVSEIVEATQKGPVVMFIDDIHNLCPAPPSGNNGAAILKPALGRGLLKCIGASTVEKFKKTIEQDAALERRFQQVPVAEPDVDQTISVLRGLRARYEAHHSIKINESAVVAAAKLSARYVSGRCLPDKAIDLLDEAAAAVRMQKTLKPEDLDVVDRRVAQLVKERDQIKAKLAEEKYKPGTGGKMAAACLQGLQEQLAAERAKQTKISSELEKEQKAARDHKRASAELSFGERRLANAKAKQAQAASNIKKVGLALSHLSPRYFAVKTPGDDSRYVPCNQSDTRERCNDSVRGWKRRRRRRRRRATRRAWRRWRRRARRRRRTPSRLTKKPPSSWSWWPRRRSST